MEKLHKLLFELSSAERATIMVELQKRRMKLSQTSRKMNLTVAETSRHLQRLGEAKLIHKDTDGYFGLTPFGVLALSLLSGLKFISDHREYFAEYDSSRIPYEFIERVGELEECVHATEVLRNLEEGENMIRDAGEFVWILSDQILASSIPILAQKVKTPFDLRIILPEGRFPPEKVSKLPSTMPSVQKRVLSKIDVLIVLTEKQGVFCLPNLNGKIDYTGFNGKDARFRKWCRDLFLHYWEKAQPFCL